MDGIFLGTAGWSVPRDVADRFPAEGSGLERYASHFPVVEINSSFHRPHRPATWQRWHDSVPDGFRFSVKVPKEITHVRKLVGCSEALGRFIEHVQILGEKLAVLLIQLPPKLEFDSDVASSFLDTLRAQSAVELAVEPRNPSWFTPETKAFLRDQRVTRVAADPAIRPEAAVPGGSDHLSYWRLHGSPVIYRSSYEDRLDQIANALRADAAAGRPVWCIFDNTASSAGGRDASNLMRRLSG